ncbi:MAG: hypothetical protein J6Y78_16510 [Paludibacteraceae bacterium]|nr:hypothetical protein [Paludibacteraceae bacterium]
MLKIKTTKLQEMLTRAIKGAGNNKLKPATTLLAIEVKDSRLTITTTDDTNYLYITEDIEGDDFYVCVPIEKFPKLISKLTCEDVILDVKDNYLEVIGNGTYHIEWQLDDASGEMAKFFNPLESFDFGNKVGHISLSTIKTMLSAIRPSLGISPAKKHYMNYFVGNTSIGNIVLATDSYKISALKTDIFTDNKARLLRPDVVDLLDTMIDDNIEIFANEVVFDGETVEKIVFRGEHGTLCGYTAFGISLWNSEAISNYLQQDYPSNCKIAKADLLQALDRISLFVDYLDNNIIDLKFEDEGISLSSKKSNGCEMVEYTQNNKTEEASGIISLERFTTQIKAQTTDVVSIQYGDGKSIKMVDDKIILVVALGE